MRVLQIINSLNVGGAEKLLIESLPCFCDAGLKVDVVLLTSKKNILKSDLLKSGFRGKIYELSNKSVYNPFLIFKLMRLIDDYDVLHVHLFPSLYWAVIGRIFCRKNPKIVYTEHSTKNRRRKSRIFQSLDKFVYKKLDKIVAIAEDVRTELIRYLGPTFSGKIIKIENGINLGKYREAKPYSATSFFGGDDFVLIQVSSFRFPKDQMTVIKSLKYLPENYKLLLVGEGETLPICKSYVTENRLNHRVKFLGIRHDIPRLLKTVDTVILSSEYEGLSLSSIEGMACGKPFIGSNVIGLREMVGGFGILFEYSNEVDLADKVKLSIEDVEYRRNIIEGCNRRSSQFDITQMVSKYLKLYYEV